jgi:hypothetical protein
VWTVADGLKVGKVEKSAVCVVERLGDEVVVVMVQRDIGVVE